MRLLTASLAVIVIHGITAHFSLLWRINILTIVLIDEPPLISSVIPILICEIKCEEGLLLLRTWMLATSFHSLLIYCGCLPLKLVYLLRNDVHLFIYLIYLFGAHIDVHLIHAVCVFVWSATV